MGIPRFHRCDGYTLLEVLVALCIFSIAALGVSELQWHAFSAIQRAALQGEALALATDIAERLRGLPDRETLLLDSDSPLPDIMDCERLACSAAQLAAVDLREWLTAVRSRLPGARLRVCADGAPWDAATAALRWDCADAGPVWVKLGWRDDVDNASAPRLALPLPESGR
ncbi:type IV pilus modification protein PilV [Noviherbaspirillum pedocola]|uniref:Type IV pilus modification protein PilV n=1 Tax=Noviherbaspirillum pedocola TaxID=2801341 RepID=A0A934SVR9_9BURK|nr:type IV pilus modification protein PilV [Noviherbaspirillum pedocola]MBK4733604.1 type IV pilus modification protein PilV [Noviherbaspirillum pedocola]